MFEPKYISELETKLLSDADKLGLEQAVIDYAKELQTELSRDGDEAYWLDCLEMAYNEIVQSG